MIQLWLESSAVTANVSEIIGIDSFKGKEHGHLGCGCLTKTGETPALPSLDAATIDFA